VPVDAERFSTTDESSTLTGTIHRTIPVWSNHRRDREEVVAASKVGLKESTRTRYDHPHSRSGRAGGVTHPLGRPGQRPDHPRCSDDRRNRPHQADVRHSKATRRGGCAHPRFLLNDLHDHTAPPTTDDLPSIAGQSGQPPSTCPSSMIERGPNDGGGSGGCRQPDKTRASPHRSRLSGVGRRNVKAAQPILRHAPARA
jgi:hypothetical protein